MRMRNWQACDSDRQRPCHPLRPITKSRYLHATDGDLKIATKRHNQSQQLSAAELHSDGSGWLCKVPPTGLEPEVCSPQKTPVLKQRDAEYDALLADDERLRVLLGPGRTCLTP